MPEDLSQAFANVPGSVVSDPFGDSMLSRPVVGALLNARPALCLVIFVERVEQEGQVESAPLGRP